MDGLERQGGRSLGSAGKAQSRPAGELEGLERAITDLTVEAQRCPSPAVYRKLAAYYALLDEREEAAVILDMAHSVLNNPGFSSVRV